MSVFPRFRLNCLSSERETDEKIKKKRKPTPTIDALVVGPTVSPKINQINQSYSDIDYFPMISGNSVENLNSTKSPTSQSN